MSKADVPQEPPQGAKQPANAQAPSNVVTLDLNQDIPPKRVKKRSSQWIMPLAAIFSIYWLGAVTAFLMGAYGWDSLRLQSTEWWGVVSIIVMLPIIFLLMVALIAKRANELKEEATYLATIAARLIEPEDHASRSMTRLGNAVRRQVESLEKELDRAIKRVGAMESNLKAQTITLKNTSQDTETRMTDMRAALEAERKELEELTVKIAKQSQDVSTQLTENTNFLGTTLDAHHSALSETMGSQTEALVESSSAQTNAIRTATSEAIAQLNNAHNILKERLEALETSTNSAFNRAQETGDRLSTQAGDVQRASKEAARQAETVSQTYQDQSQSLRSATETLVQESTKLEGQVTSQRDLLKSLSEDVTHTAQELDSLVTTAHDKLEGVMLDASTRAMQLTDDFAANAEKVTTAGDEAAIALSKASQAAHTASTDSRQALNDNAEKIKHDIESTAASLASSMDKLTHENLKLKSAFDAQSQFLNQVPDLVAVQSRKIEDLVTTSSQQMKEAIDDAASHAASIEGRMKEQALSVRTSGEGAASALTAGLHAAQKTAEETRTLLSARTTRIVDELEEAGQIAEQAVERAQQALETRSKALKSMIAQSGTAAEEAASSAQTRLQEQLNDIRSQITKSSAIADEAVGKFTTSISQIGSATQDANETVSESLQALEARIDEFPEQTRESAERIRDIVIAQMTSLTDIAEESANRVLNMDEAFQTRLQGIYETLGRLLPAPPTEPLTFDPAGASRNDRLPPRRPSQAFTPQNIASPDAQQDTAWKDMPKPPSAPDQTEASLSTSDAATDSGLAQRLAKRLRKSIDNPDEQESHNTDFAKVLSDATGGEAKLEDVKRAIEESIQAHDADKSARVENKIEPIPLQPLKEPRGKAQDMKWRDILSAADAHASHHDQRTPSITDIPMDEIAGSAVHIIETLQAMTVDLNRSLEKDPPVKLVQRYLEGERNLFAKRLVSMENNAFLNLIQEKYAKDKEFQGYVDRYISQFKSLLDNSNEAKDGLQDTYHKADTGRVYDMLIRALQIQ